MADLELDFTGLLALRSRIESARSDVAHAESVAHRVAELTGHAGLGGRIDEFADNWSINRDRLLGQLAFVSDAVDSIVDTFTDLDRALAAAADELVPGGPSGTTTQAAASARGVQGR